MHPIFGIPDEYEELNRRCKDLVQQIVSTVTPFQPKKILPAQRSLFLEAEEKDYLYVLSEGIINCFHKDRTIYFFEAGDLVGLSGVIDNDFFSYKTDFAVIADCYKLKDIYLSLDTVERKRLWHELFAVRVELLNMMVAMSAKTNLEMHPETLTAQPGEVIIEQGTVGTDVYTLVEGHLQVVVDGVIVGEVMPDEIFGAMAALTETPRSATVTATDFSVILKLPRERFLDLITTRPLTVLRMIEDMSRTIVSLNERVVQLTSSC